MTGDSQDRLEIEHAYVVGKITKCFGVRGYVAVHSYTQSPGRIKDFRVFFVGTSMREHESYDVEDVRRRGRSVLVKFRSIDDRTTAEKLVGMYLFGDRREVAQPAKGTYFVDQIVGCKVWSDEGNFLGVIRDVLKLPAQDVWVVTDGDKEHWIPAVKQFIRSVDTKERKVVVNVIEGLIENKKSSKGA